MKNKFMLIFDCSNDVFQENMRGEISRILKETARRIDKGNFEETIFDVNGNNVGHYKLSVRLK